MAEATVAKYVLTSRDDGKWWDVREGTATGPILASEINEKRGKAILARCNDGESPDELKHEIKERLAAEHRKGFRDQIRTMSSDEAIRLSDDDQERILQSGATGDQRARMVRAAVAEAALVKEIERLQKRADKWEPAELKRVRELRAMGRM
jgi:hypothetical protein